MHYVENALITTNIHYVLVKLQISKLNKPEIGDHLINFHVLQFKYMLLHHKNNSRLDSCY